MQKHTKSGATTPLNSVIHDVNAVETDLNVLWGTPVFSGTHVPAVTLFDYLATGATFEEFLQDFPSVRREFAEQVLQEANQPS